MVEQLLFLNKSKKLLKTCSLFEAFNNTDFVCLNLNEDYLILNRLNL